MCIIGTEPVTPHLTPQLEQGKLRHIESQPLHLPHMKTVLVKCPPAKEWGDADQEGVGPDEDEDE